MLDDIDAKILDVLQKNGRTKRNDLAEIVGLSLPSVSERLRKLEETGYIKGYVATVDPKMVGKDITAFIFVSVESSKQYAGFVEHALATDDILECHAITGEGSHLIKIRTENTLTLEKLLAKIQSWQGVAGTRTNVVLSSPKEHMRIKLNHIK
ncbi:MAG TPA: Lrp/AsnC family transcriptional regulator [Bacteroidota bacterium]|jgi:Lrp/AsnC family leucine-responsive transcriptional regulator|nr:Lrp/AsnC family transcriptional regulator [Bacteroidota bacterium]